MFIDIWKSNNIIIKMLSTLLLEVTDAEMSSFFGFMGIAAALSFANIGAA